MDFSDESDGDDTPLGAAKFLQEKALEAATQVDENKEEEKAQVPPENLVPIPVEPLEPPPQMDKQFTMQVAKVQNSSLVQGLESGELTAADAQRCRDIIGYTPPNLLDRNVQRSMLATGHPNLAQAFDNKMNRAFLVGVNSASFTLGYGMISLQISRHLLTECVKRLSLTSECRGKLIPIATKINESIDMLDQKRAAFVLQMQEISKTMGAMSNLMRFNANHEKILQRLEGVNTDLKGRMQEIDDAAQVSLQPVQDGAQYILTVLREDDGYQRAEADVKAKDTLWLAEMAKYQAKLREVKGEEYRLQGTLEELKVNLKTKKKQLQHRSADLPAIEARIANHERTITAYLEAHRKVQEGEADDEKAVEAIEAETKAAAKKEIADQREGLLAQIALIDKEINKKNHQAEDMRGRSKTASDGVERQTTYSHSGYHRSYWWRWYGSYSYKSEYKQVRPNEKQRLENMALVLDGEVKELHSKREALQAKIIEVKRTLIAQMSDESLKIRRDESQARATIRQKRMDSINQQIKFMERLKEVSQGERDAIQVDTRRLESEIGDLQREIVTAQDALDTFLKDDGDQKLLKALKQNEADALQALSNSKKELQKYTTAFGSQTGDDFTSFMRIFSMLNGSIQTLPSTLVKMNGAFDVAASGFNSEVFRKDLEMFDDPEHVKLYLKGTMDEVHAICELAFTVVDMPGRAMMAVDGSKAVAAIEASSQSIEVETNEQGQEYTVEEA